MIGSDHVKRSYCLSDKDASTGQGKPNKRDTYSDCFENAPLALQLVDDSGVILHANQASLDLFGCSASDYIGRPFESFFVESAEAAQIMAELAAGKLIKARPALLNTRAGQKSVLLEGNAYFEGDSFQYARVFAQDITGLVLTDSPTELKHEVLKILAESSTTNEAIARLVPTMAQALGCDIGLAWRAEEKGNHLERLVLWRADPHAEVDYFLSKSNNISLNLSSGFPANLWFSDRAHKIVAGKDVRFCGSEMALSLPQYKQIVSVPIAIGRLNWGLFGFFARAESEVSPTLLTTMEALGSQIGQFIERQQVFENYQKMQESYSLAIAGANDGIWDWDFTTNVAYFSPRWKSLLGFEDHELENHFDTFRALTHPDDYPRIMDAVQNHIESREPYAEECRMRTKTGDYRWISTRGHCSYNSTGQPVRMAGSHRDITDIKEAELARLRSEARLLESESKFKQLAENIREVFWILSADRQEFFYVSPAFEEVWGARCQDLYKDASIFFEAMVDEDKIRISQLLDCGTIPQSGLELEFRIDRADGSGRSAELLDLDSRTGPAEVPGAGQNLRWMWAKIFPINDDQGNLSRLCGIAHDITNKKEVEKHVNEFYATISHELRTPLTSIRAALGLVEGGLTGDISAETLQYTSIARDNCDRLIRLINDMLDLKKMEANHLEFRLVRLNARAVMQTTMDSLKPYAEQSGVLLAEVPESIVLDCIGDNDRVIQILTNLLSNAIKYTPPGKSVWLSAGEGHGGSVRFSVKDEGPGIGESEKRDLFGPFQQLSCIENEINRGTGLGLAISKVLVEKQKGTIGVNSRIGEGAEFWFELPPYTSDKALKKLQSGMRSQAQLAPGQIESRLVDQGLAQPLILILEDSDSIAHILKSLLCKKGYSAVRSATIADAKELLKTISPDLVIADVHLPDGNGIAFINWLHEPGRSKQDTVPVIVLSGVAANHKNLKHPSTVDWVRKPFDGENLLSLIKQRLDKVVQAGKVSKSLNSQGNDSGAGGDS